ncbi:voltage-dependent anion channel [Aspergillus pseudotamarii]|uniref:Voltage-dependent anion channel n=1 Tax=Aspergillus pseudotamarii TaxID=132259 RepID=A0A5N6T3J4_ASPPS|nr:voltage-dependent anion channel [Aspergillus pseudotamarii]KAE8140873.1 voltage-dependent anion channel [Aspergillus pseudotamarii]
MTVLVLVRQWGAAWGIVAYVLWWINTAMAVVVVMGIPYVFVKIQSPGVKAVLPGVLLPLISALTSAAGGGVICQYGALGSRLQVPVIIVSFLEVGLGLTLAITLTDIFMTRLFDQSFPAMEEIYQDMILCGPFGQASFALQALGQAVLRDAFADYDRGTFLTAEAAKPIGFASELAGLLVWGYGTFWWCFAILSISHALISRARHRQHTSFTLAAWSLVFPWGVYTNAAVELGKLMDSPAFKVWSTALLIIVLVIWIVNHYFTVKGLVTGDLLGLNRVYESAPITVNRGRSGPRTNWV